jgi:hypothetical protein
MFSWRGATHPSQKTRSSIRYFPYVSLRACDKGRFWFCAAMRADFLPCIDTWPRLRQHSAVTDPSAILRELPAVVFVNPLAGAGRAGTLLPQVREAFAARQIPADFLLTESAHDLESRVSGAIADGRRLLFAMGGDGTFQLLVNAAFGADVLFGLRPEEEMTSPLRSACPAIPSARCGKY